MTTEEKTSSVPVTAVLAMLILLGDRKRLAEPIALNARHYRNDGSHDAVSVELRTYHDLRAWCRAAGGKVRDIVPMIVPDNNYTHHHLRMHGWAGTGWDVEFTFNAELSQATTPLDTETIAGLASVAAGEPTPDISIERYDDLVGLLNSFRTFEFEDGKDLLSDANLDEALRWIADQPDVAHTVQVRDSGTASVTLTDGTVIAWIATERSWSVTVTEDAAEPEHNQYTRPWRSQVQIVAQDPGRGITSVRIPARDNDTERIGLDLGFDFPTWLADLPVGTRVYADVNVGAESAEDLVFTNWTKS